MSLHIEEQGGRKLAVALGGGGRSHALAKLTSLRGSPGWLVGRDTSPGGGGFRVTEWRFEGFSERDGEPYLYGPEAPGRMLSEVLELPLAEALAYIARVADALATLAERGYRIFPLASDAVVLTDAGGVLFLPPEMMRELRAVRPFSENRDTFEALNHPDLKGEELACFTLGVALYRTASGRFPFTGGSEEEVHEQARQLQLVPLADLVAGFDSGASDLVMASLARPRPSRVTLARWRDGLASWQRSGLVHEVDAEEAARVARAAAAREQSAQKRFATRTFWQKNWRLVAIIGGVVLVVGLVIGSIVKGAFAPRPTYGWNAQQVVVAFYSGMNSLNSQIMEGCVVNRAGQGEINEVTNLYVIGRVQMGYEGKSNTISAGDWAAAGRPKIPAGTALYGVTDLSVSQVLDTSSPEFVASYVKWTPVSPESTSLDTTAQLRTEGVQVTDRVYMRRDLRLVDKILRPGYPGDWVIYRFDRTTGKQVPPPEYLPESSSGSTAPANPLGAPSPQGVP